MVKRIDLDEIAVALSVGLLPYDDGSGFEVRATIRSGQEERPDQLELSQGDGDVRFSIKSWPQVRDAIDKLMAFHLELAAESEK
jgi:hypothetical protein